MRTMMMALALAVLMAASAVGQGVIVERIQDLPLTDAQEAKIAEIRKDSRGKVGEAAKDLATLLKSEMGKIREVLTAEQREKVQGLKEDREERRDGSSLAHAIASLKDLDLTDAEMAKIGAIRKEYQPKLFKSLKELDGMFSEEQKKVRTEALTEGKKRSEILAALNLTADQKDKVVAVGKALGGLVREEMEQIRDLLSASQKEQLGDLKDERKEQARHRLAHMIVNLKDLNLSDDQRTKLADIRNDFRPKVHEAGNRLRATIRDEVERIVAVIKE